VKERILKITRYFLLILFIGYYASITFFTHIHHIENGVVIVHSHPFRQGTGTNPVNHTHTPDGYLLLQFITTFLNTVIVTGTTWLLARELYVNFRFSGREEIPIITRRVDHHGLRAPPLKY